MSNIMTTEEENYWRGYIDAKVEDMGKVRMYRVSVAAQLKKRDELLTKHGLKP